MQRVGVKICGVRTYEEARTALDCGADFLGFNFWKKSPRYIQPIDARGILQRLKPFNNSIGVFVNEEQKNLAEVLYCTGIITVQLHGDESFEYCQQFGYLKIIKAFRVGAEFDIEVLKNFPVGCFLLDSKVKGEYGGTGQRFDWRIAMEAKQIAPIILAGGINIENVGEAIQYVRPYAIDVCSGVEAEPGRKDLSKLRDFMAEVDRANRIIEGENQPQITQITRI
jgi:phosphoribosylanthranilate isomerase